MSARKSLRERLEQAQAAAYIDLKPFAPGFDGLYVRCRALRPDELDRSMEQHKDEPQAGVAQAIDLLVMTCLGIWEDVDGKGLSPVDGFDGTVDVKTGTMAGRFPTFSDPQLAEAFGVENGSAASAVRALLAPHGSDLPLTSYSQEILQFSTAARAELVAESRGN